MIPALAAVALVIGAFLAMPGLYNIDETIYFLAADALGREGSLTVENGFETYGADRLRLRFLVPGPNGLAPQYPAGTAALGAPLLALFGVRGLILVNALAAAAALLLTRALALRLGFGRGEATGAVLILLFGTFFVEYAFGIWPHVLQTALVLGALWAAAGVITGNTEAPRRDALLSGLCIGGGLLVRLDTVLLLPAIGAMALLYAPRPVMTIALGAAGLLPGLLAGAAVNAYKFGTWNPLSYGQTGGGTDLGNHLVLLPVVVLLPLALIGCRRLDWRPAMRWPLFGGVALLLVAAALLPAAQDLLLRYLRGLYTLGADLTWSTDGHPAVIAYDDGTKNFFGLWKKALGQSLPWIGVLVLLAFQPWGDRRRGFFLIALTCLFWTLPFAMRSWHGGLGSNMRYFLPLLPLLSIALASVWSGLIGGRRELLLRDLAVGAILMGLAIMGWLVLSGSGLGGVQQKLSLYMLAALAAASLAAGAGLLAVRYLRPLLAACFLMAMIQSLAIDLTKSQVVRADNARTAEILADLPGPALLIGPAQFLYFQGPRPDGLLAMPWADLTLDAELVARVLADGYRVYAFEVLAVNQGLTPSGPRVDTPFGDVVELTAADLPR